MLVDEKYRRDRVVERVEVDVTLEVGLDRILLEVKMLVLEKEIVLHTIFPAADKGRVT